jgi:hypothetical protein
MNVGDTEIVGVPTWIVDVPVTPPLAAVMVAVPFASRLTSPV